MLFYDYNCIITIFTNRIPESTTIIVCFLNGVKGEILKDQVGRNYSGVKKNNQMGPKNNFSLERQVIQPNKSKKDKREDRNLQEIGTRRQSLGICGVEHNLLEWAPKSLQVVTATMKLKDASCLEGKL